MTPLNNLRTIWHAGGIALNGWMHIPSSWSAEIMAHQGWDSLVIDMEHGFMNFESLLSMLQAIATTPTVPLVRVPWNEPGTIMRVLDAGAQGVICPMVNTRAECEAFVGACRYPPLGYRSLGPTRGRLLYGNDYAQKSGELVVTMAMVETAVALQDVDGILSVPGLDAVFVGSGDLGYTLTGDPTFPLENPQVLEALDTILAAAARHNIVPGIFVPSPAHVQPMVAKGFRFITVSTDSLLLTQAAGEAVRTSREHLP